MIFSQKKTFYNLYNWWLYGGQFEMTFTTFITDDYMKVNLKSFIKQWS